MNIVITNRAKKDMEKLDRETRLRIYSALESIANNQRVDIKKLHGSNRYRIRVGDYRIILDISQGTLTIYALRVLHRREAYNKE